MTNSFGRCVVVATSATLLVAACSSAHKVASSQNSPAITATSTPNASRPPGFPQNAFWASWLPDGVTLLDFGSANGAPSREGQAGDYEVVYGLRGKTDQRGPAILIDTQFFGATRGVSIGPTRSPWAVGDTWTAVNVRGRSGRLLRRACPAGGPSRAEPWCADVASTTLFFDLRWFEEPTVAVFVHGLDVSRDDVVRVAETLRK